MIAVEIAVLVALTLLNGLFAMSELALVSSRKVRLRQMAEQGSPGARAALRLIDDPTRFLSTVQIGITMVGVVAGAYGGATLGERFGAVLEGLPVLGGYGGTIGVGVVIVAITYLSIVLGELVPKRIALKSPERVAAAAARPMRLLSRAAAPFVWLLGTSTDLLLRLLGLQGARDATVTEEEIRSLITEGTLAGIFVPAEKEMIDGVLRLGDQRVRAIMTPRPDVVWLDIDGPPEAVLERIVAGGHSRYPVCRGTVDEVVGIVHSRDLLDRALRGLPFDLAAGMVRPMVVHDGISILRLLELMKASKMHMAMVADEYGSIEGLATMTDIMETVAGDLPDHGEESEPDAVRRDDGSWLVEGSMPIDAFETVTGLRGIRGQAGYHTIAGFVLDRLGRLPRTGDTLVHQGSRFEVVDMDGRRIDKILVVPATPAEDDSG
ncbi:MAG: hemolysin family protein [Alphaproteobacteria bacterium]